MDDPYQGRTGVAKQVVANDTHPWSYERAVLGLSVEVFSIFFHFQMYYADSL